LSLGWYKGFFCAPIVLLMNGYHILPTLVNKGRVPTGDHF